MGQYHFFESDFFLNNNLVPVLFFLGGSVFFPPAVTSIEIIGKIARFEQT